MNIDERLRYYAGTGTEFNEEAGWSPQHFVGDGDTERFGGRKHSSDISWTTQ